jgi:hypothetical protein
MKKWRLKNIMKKLREKSERANLYRDHPHNIASLMAKVIAVADQVAANLAAFANGVIVCGADALNLKAALRAIGERGDNLVRHRAGQHALKKCFSVDGNGFVRNLLFGLGVHLGGSLVGDHVLRRKPRGVNIQICQEMRRAA